MLSGTQKVAPNKRPGETKKMIAIQASLFRFRELETDILITLNTEMDQEKFDLVKVKSFFLKIVKNIQIESKEAFE